MPSEEQQPPSKDTNATPSKSGITTTADGTRHIPSSVRSDGSVRKEIRIRPGYRPPEDVEVYRNRTAEAWKNRGKGGVPGAEAVEPPGSENVVGGSKDGAAKNAKRREARRKAAAASKSNAEGSKDAENGNDKKQDEPPAPALDPEAEKDKEARKLTKKLRRARDLKDKKDSGAALLPEQFEKVIRINELIRQLDALGYDNQGEKKEEKKTDKSAGDASAS